MSHWNPGTWKNGRKKLTGSWTWVWSRRTFVIALDGKDLTTGRPREPFETGDVDHPEWGEWKLVRK